MKKIGIIFLIILCIFTFMISTYANVINGYNQVVNVGRENSSDGVKVSKTIEESSIENYFDITLKVESTEKVSEIIKDQDLAIVVVMDVSHTMIEGKVNNITRYSSAINAANDLIDNFTTYSKDVEASRMLGYVAFNTDSHEVFSLQECKDDETKEKLKTEMSTKTGNIVNKDGYKTSYTRFTNIESGLKRAKDMLDKINIKNKYIILLTDGFPTTYISSNYNGYNPYMSLKDKLPTESSEGNFYNEIYNLPCKHGTDYSDRAAIKAREIATIIKGSGINIFSVGTGLDSHNTISYYMEKDKSRINNTGDQQFATVDTEKENFEIGNTIDDYKNWLKNSIASGYYYDANNTNELKEAYDLIFSKVKELSKEEVEASWVVDDSMSESTNSFIEFVGVYDNINNLNDSLSIENENQSNTVSFSNNKIMWDLKNSECNEEKKDDITYYTYQIKYRVRLKNELDTFDLNDIYNTNGSAKLTYVKRIDGVTSEYQYLYFPIPSVKGYLGDLEFIKKSSFNNTSLEGVGFKLIHHENCNCKNERKYPTINDYIRVSDSNGIVSFKNIPSGHKYKLIETSTLDNHILSDKTYDIVINYGNVLSSIEDNIFINDIKMTNLKLKKNVIGNVNNNAYFEFDIDIYFNGELLNGEYTYKINDNKEEIINLEDNIKLKNNDEIVIYNLPVGATYSIKEINNEGYITEYKINNGSIKKGNLATCNSDNNCKLTSGINEVYFTNYAEFILPETGSSNRLIMLIIGTFLLMIPVIYKLYLICKKKGNV